MKGANKQLVKGSFSMTQVHEFRDVSDIYKRGLCTQCGFCQAVCPVHAITMFRLSNGDYRPEIDRSRCMKACSLCYEICPGHDVDYDALQREIFVDVYNKKKEPWVGTYHEIYLARSNNQNLPQKVSSGGLVTTILLYLLNERLIDGAIVAGMKEREPLEPNVFIARTPEEIISAAGSKYFPIPMGIGMKKVVEHAGVQDKKYAFVGLPCHINGLRKVCSKMPSLKTNIYLTIGLFCGFSVNALATRFMLKRLGINDLDKVASVSYRTGNYPGYFEVATKNGRVKRMTKHEFSSIVNSLFVSTRCLTCNDFSAELADISAGDSWNPEFPSIILARTAQGANTLTKLLDAEVIKARQFSLQEFRIAKESELRYKKETVGARIKILKFLGYDAPRYTNHYSSPSLLDYLRVIPIIVNTRLTRSSITRKILSHLPERLLKFYTIKITYWPVVRFTPGWVKVQDKVRKVYKTTGRFFRLWGLMF